MNILMSGSGSGGHIYPCISLYKELIKENKITLVIFKAIDKKIYELNNIKYTYIDDNLSPLKKIKEIRNIFKNNNVDMTMTFGGKNSFFIQLVSKTLKVKSFIFEQNAIIGKANKVNLLFADKMFTNFKINHKKAIKIGNPNAYNIKVNAVCPGNYLDGPLWSDPVRGLFVQYLEAGKVPGAKTVEDVRAFYEAKVPMNRGCLPVDVARAVMYCVEQKYETGQAIPVTGGQVMLN